MQDSKYIEISSDSFFDQMKFSKLSKSEKLKPNLNVLGNDTILVYSTTLRDSYHNYLANLFNTSS